MRGVRIPPANAGSPGVALASDADVESTHLTADAHGVSERRNARRDGRVKSRLWISLAMVGLLALVVAAIATRPPPARSADLEMNLATERPDAERHRADIAFTPETHPTNRDDERTPSRKRRRERRRAIDQNTRH